MKPAASPSQLFRSLRGTLPRFTSSCMLDPFLVRLKVVRSFGHFSLPMSTRTSQPSRPQRALPDTATRNTPALSNSNTALRQQGQYSERRYVSPQSGLMSLLPRAWIPYAELVRLDKPAGTYYLFFPCAFSTLLAATMAAPAISIFQVLETTGLFFAGAFIMRGAGCAINDLWDRNLDRHVERTKFRPIARGAISPNKALIFTGTQLLAGLGILLQLPYQCLYYGIPSLLLVGSYPLAKRVTYYPQAVLGLTFSWGAIMGFPALGIDLLSHSNAVMAAGALYSSCVCWTILYDMIYAHMDIKDDVAAGIKSIALRHEHNTKTVLSGLAAVQLVLLGAAGVLAGVGPVYFISGCGSAALSLGIMIRKVQLKSTRSCWWWFRNGCLLTGGGISVGILLEYLVQISGAYDTNVKSRLPGEP